MKILFPYRYKKIGWSLLVPGIILGIIYLISKPEPEFLDITVLAIAAKSIFDNLPFISFIDNNMLDEIIGLLLISGGIFVAFSKEKIEDELISKIRLDSLLWATYVNYIVLIITIVLIYDLLFFWVLVFNMFTTLFFFIIRFNWALKKYNRDEE